MAVFTPTSDQEYKNWINDNQVGFVLNTTTIPDPTYMVLHAHTCRTINIPISTASENSFTQKDYIKVCSTTIDHLRKWVSKNGRENGSFSVECQKCNPQNYTFLSLELARKMMADYNKGNGHLYPKNKLLKERDFIISQIQKGITPESAFKKAVEKG